MKQYENAISVSKEYTDASNQQIVMEKLWDLLKWQVRKYNGIDSTSLPIEKVQSLLESLLYTIYLVADIDNIPIDLIFQKNLQDVIRRGQTILEEKHKAARENRKLMCLKALKIRNVYYYETLKNIGQFFKKYDIYSAAHQIPCSIEYPLCYPISEKIKGITYIEEYICRIQIENDFLECFDQKQIIRLYESSIPDYEEMLFNLCDPVLTNVIGLAMIRQEVRTLNITEEQRNTIISTGCNKTAEEIESWIKDSISFACVILNIQATDEIAYLRNASRGLSIRLREAIKQEDLSHIFISLLPNERISPADFI